MNSISLSATITNTLISHSGLVWTVWGLILVLSVLGLAMVLKQPLYTSQDITADVTRNNNLKEVA